jgi:hypothetical protein
MNASVRILLAPAALAVLVTGCAATGTERAHEARLELQSAYDRLADARRAGEAARDNLSVLLATTSGDLEPRFATFEASVVALRRRAESVARLPEQLRARGDAYFDQWGEDLTVIQDPALRAASASRRGEALAAYNRIVGTLWSAEPVFQPLLALLRDVRVVLGNDLTRAGLDSVAGMSERVAQQTATVSERLDALIAEVDVVAEALSSSLSP